MNLGYYLNLALSTIRALNRKDDIYTIPGKADEGKEEDDENMDVGDAVCPWQLPLLTETSSIAKSPV